MLRWLPVALILSAGPVWAESYVPLNDESAFRSMVEGRELRYGMFGIALVISPDGRINGEALGSEVTGTWTWRDGYFCRQMNWSGMDIPYNCQLVEVQDRSLRFTTDKGAGESAAFALR